MTALDTIDARLAAGRGLTLQQLAAELEPLAPGVGRCATQLLALLAVEGVSVTIDADAATREQAGVYLSVGAAIAVAGLLDCRLELMFGVDEDGAIDSVLLELRELRLHAAQLLERIAPAGAVAALQPLLEVCEQVHARISVLVEPGAAPQFEVELWAEQLRFPALDALSLDNARLLLRRAAPDQPPVLQVSAQMRLGLGAAPGADPGPDPEPEDLPGVTLQVPLRRGASWHLRLDRPLYLLHTPLAVLGLVESLFPSVQGGAFAPQQLKQQLPDCLHALDSLALDKFELSFDPFAGAAAFQGLDLRIGLTQGTQLAPSVSLQCVSLYVRVARGGAQLWLHGALLLPGGAWCHADADIPLGERGADWSLSLRAGFKPPRGLRHLALPHGGPSVVGAGLPEAFLDIEEVTLSEFTLRFNPFTPALSSLELEIDVEMEVGIAPFLMLDRVEFALGVNNVSDSASRTYHGSLLALARVGGLPFQARAARDDDGSWTFAASLERRGLTMRELAMSEQLGLPALPPHLAMVSLDALAFELTTGSRELRFHWGVTVPLVLDGAGQPTVSLHLDSTFALRRPKDSKQCEVRLDGSAQLGAWRMSGALARSAGAWQLQLDWGQRGTVRRDQTVGLDDLMHLLGQEAALPPAPPGLEPRLQWLHAQASLGPATRRLDLELTLWELGQGALRIQGAGKDGARALLAAGVVVRRTLRLSQLPLVGKLLPPELDIGLADPWLMLANRVLDSDDMRDFTTLLLGSAAAGAGPAQIAVGLELDLGGARLPLMLGLAPGQRRARLAAPPHTPPQGALRPLAVEAEVPDGPAGATRWIVVQKNLGPLSLRRIGVRFEQGELGVLVDGAVQVAGLTLEAAGLGLSSPLASFAPRFHLSGLGILFDKAPLMVGAGLRVCDDAELAQMSAGAGRRLGFAMSGSALLRVAQVAVAGVGGLAQFDDGGTAIFVFAELRAPIGGDPAFFITGFSGGLGVNYNLRLPRIGEVWSCPFVAGLFAPDAQGKTPGPLQVLGTLCGGAPAAPPWLQPMPGAMWLAAGLRFTTYKMVETNAVAVAVIGPELSFSLMGVCTASLGQDNGAALACIEVEFQASLKPLSGYLGLGGGLTPRSWLLVRECVLSGSMAACWWLDPARPDFVVSVGGYHPAFQRPAAWPVLGRLGFNWRYGDKVVIKGGVYGALTPACVMAGGALDIAFASGGLKAWFQAHADFLMRYQPLSFTAEVGLCAGVSYDIDFLFIKKTIRLELSASMRLDGPPLRGQVVLNLYLFDVHVAFGAPAAPPALPDWASVKRRLLAPDSERVSLRMDAGVPGAAPAPAQGRLAAPGAPDGAARQGVLPAHASSAGFTLDADFAAPATSVWVQGTALAGAQELAPFGVRPCACASAGVRASAWITVLRDGQPLADLGAWRIAPRLACLAAGLWGAPEADGQPRLDGERHTHALVTGVRASPRRRRARAPRR
ncbi:hypothetical protein HF313_16680 [Massilia atriviolacea]|uniref:DUF6603 domain-containing protein n=1 Tax=Massilia atriviolacea TaxID=2495579 RepID=UPI003857E330